MVINLKTAKTLGLTILETLLATADEVSALSLPLTKAEEGAASPSTWHAALCLGRFERTSIAPGLHFVRSRGVPATLCHISTVIMVSGDPPATTGLGQPRRLPCACELFRFC